MEALLPIAIYWSLAVWGVFSRRPVLLWLFFGILPFGTLAIVPPQLTGNLSLVGSSMTAALIVARQFLLYRNGLQSLGKRALRGDGLVLLLFWGVGLVVTFFAPRLFAGQIDIVPMTVSDFMEIMPLTPTKQNFSQFAYISVSVFSVFAFAQIFRSPKIRPLLIRGIMFSSTITVITGILSYLSSFLPIDRFLDIFKTAQYAILDRATLSDGTLRITGLMPEASSFGSLTLTLLSCLYFLRRMIDDRVQMLRANMLVVAMAILLVMSTSSGGYVGIGVLVGLIGLDWFTRVFRIARPKFLVRGVHLEFFLALAGLGFVAAALMIAPNMFDPAIARIDEMVFNKTETGSYIERSMWTSSSFEAGLDSYLIGVGLGSTRASNFAVSIFASTGILGFLLYFGFVIRLMLRSAPANDPYGQMMCSALQWSFFPPFIVSLLIATTPDFGVFEALRFGVLLALTQGLAVRHAGVESLRDRTQSVAARAR